MEYQDQPANPTAYLPPRQGEAEQRAAQIKVNLLQDMHTTAVTNGVSMDADMESLADAWANDAMFQIEHLLVEIEALHIERVAREKGSLSEPEPTWGMD
jgi:hypothetical protein